MGKLRALFDAEDVPRLTCHDVEARLFIDVRNAREYIKILHAERYIYVCDHRRDSQHGKYTPIYEKRVSDDQVDAKPPSKLTETEIRRRFRQNPENWEQELKAARIRRKRQKFLAEPIALDPLMAAVNRDATISRL